MKRKMMKRVVSFALAVMMAFTAIMVGGVEEVKAADTYEIVVTPSAPTAKEGESVTLTATVTKNGTEVTDLSADGLAMYWWCTNNDNSGVTYDSSNSTLTNSVLVNTAGDYYFTVKLQETTGWSTLKEVYITLTGTENTSGSPIPTNPVYNITVSPSAPSVEAGNSVDLTAAVTKDSAVVTDLSAEKLAVYWWCTNNDNNGVEYNSSSSSLTNNVKVNTAGEYYFTIKLQETENWTTIKEVYITLTGTGSSTSTTPVYTIEATTDKTSVEEGGTVKITAVVKKDGVVVPQDELDDEDLQVWFWADKWQTGHESGLVDATFANYDNNSGYSLTADVTLPNDGTYYIMAELRKTAPSETEKGAWVDEECVTLTATAATSDDTNTEGGNTTTPSDDKNTTEKEEEKTDEKPVVIELDNSNFSTATDGTWTGEIAKGEWQNGNDMQVLSYSSDSYLELPSYVGTTGLKFNMEQGNTMTISQWVDSLKAGTYTITAPVMGENTDVYLVLGDKEIKATSLSGYNSWTKAKATFKITEDMTDVKVGFKLVATSTGSDSWSWGWIDSIQLIKTVPGTGDTSNIYAYVLLMMSGLALLGYSVKRNKVQF